MPRKLPLLITTDLQQDTASIKRTRAVNHYALAVAKKLGSPLEALHVTDIGELSQIPQAAEAILRSQESQLKNLVNPFQEIRRAKFVLGHPASVINKITSRKGRYEMLVQGSSGRTGVERVLLGSVAEEVLRNSKIPVMTVGPEAQNPAQSEKLNREPHPTLLLATGLDKSSLSAERFALQFAKRLHAKVHAIHHLRAGLHPLIQTAMSTPSGSRELQELFKKLKKDTEKSMSRLSAQFKKSKIEFSSSIVVHGIHASDGILEELKKSGATLIIMGTHARGLVLGGFLGRTARSVILQAPVPVITVQR